MLNNNESGDNNVLQTGMQIHFDIVTQRGAKPSVSSSLNKSGMNFDAIMLKNTELGGYNNTLNNLFPRNNPMGVGLGLNQMQPPLCNIVDCFGKK